MAKCNYRRAKDNLYLLSFLDTADRLNILLLEVRHLQQSIIDSLHAPTLYLPLRHEEKFIFGGWEKSKKRTIVEKTEQAILRYPSPKDAIDYWSKYHQGDQKDAKRCQGNNIEKRLLSRIGEIWSADMWVRGERQHYHSLRALQILKQQIFHDKVRLFHDAKYAGLLNENHQKHIGLEKPEFLILRRGIHFRLERYINSLRTHQQSFGKSLDFGLQRYPRPSVDRRREIGIFNDFLSNRTTDLQADTLHLLEQITNLSETELYDDSSMILHGWSPLMNVRNKQLWDNVRRDYKELKSFDNIAAKQDISYLDTSFWSPDRPDLQPLVSKEVAYSALRSLSDGFSDDYFANNASRQDHLSQLWVTLSKQITHMSYGIVGLEVIHKNSDLLIRDLVSDCLAVSLKGISYLYALFLSSVGAGLENLLRVNGAVRLSSVAELTGGIAAYEAHYSWYFRLKFTAFWLKKISTTKHTPLSKLDHIVFDGIDQVCEELIDFLDCHNISAARHPVGSEWRKICKKLEKSFKKAKILKIITHWRNNRSRDTWDEKWNKSGKKEYHRSTIRLDVRLQNFIFLETLQRKTAPKKALSGFNMTDKNSVQEFCNAYGVSLDSIYIPHTQQKFQHSNQLFRQLHDIPFQCSIMRSIDLLGRLDNKAHPYVSWFEFVQQSHEDMSLGREIFSFALEFYTWNRESPKSRVLLSINMLSFLLPSLYAIKIAALGDFTKIIERWLYNSSEHIVDKIQAYSHKKIRKVYLQRKSNDLKLAELQKIGAIQLYDAFCDTTIAASKRRLEQVAGYKLRELLQILEQTIRPLINDRRQQENIYMQCRNIRSKIIVDGVLLLGNLIEFLRIRDESRCKGIEKNNFFSLLLHACNTHYPDNISENNSHTCTEIVPVVITRLALSSAYTTANPKRNLDKINSDNIPSLWKYRNQNMLGLADVLKQDRWLQPITTVNNHNNQSNNYNHYSIVLGRYDVVSFVNTNLPCLCRISHFPDRNGKLQINNEDDIEVQNASEAFVSHFPRREIAFSLKLYGDCCFNDEDYQVYAISSISLQRRSMRLNLLYRLLNARCLNGQYTFVDSSVEHHLNHLITAFEALNQNNNELVIKVLLTDGWGDILLVFMCRKGAIVGDLHDDLIYLQQAFYEDFMVDRTELIYTPQCLDHMNFRSQYRFYLVFRFQEDRQLERSILNFIEALKAKRQDLPAWINQDGNGGGDFDIVFTPGQYDVRVGFHLDPSYHKRFDNIYNILLEWLAKPQIEVYVGERYSLYNQWYNDGLSFIDKIETMIERVQ